MVKCDTDVLVVGGGPVGLLTGAELIRFGARCEVVESRSERDRGTRALAVHARTLELFGLRGTAAEFVARGRVLGRAHLVLGAHRRVTLPFEELDSPFPFVLIIPQGETERLLERDLITVGGRVLRGRTVTGLGDEGDHVCATVRGPDGSERTVRARWVVAADGAHSRMRSLVGATSTGEREGLAYYGADVCIDAAAPELQLVWSTAGFGVLAPYADGSFRVAVTAPASSSLPDPPTLQDIEREVRRVFPERMVLRHPTWLTVLHSGHRQLQRYRHGRILFAGDAAHTHNPAGGQGMNVGLQDAFNLGWKLAGVATGRAADVLLDTYEAERRPAAARVITQTERMMRLAHLRSAPARALRDAVARAMPSAMRLRLLEQIAGIDSSYRPDVRTAPAPGTRLPDARLLTTDGHLTTLHSELAGRGHAQLEFDEGRVTATGGHPATTMLDHHGDVRRKIGLSDGSRIRIRPDGYIAD